MKDKGFVHQFTKWGARITSPINFVLWIMIIFDYAENDKSLWRTYIDLVWK